LGEVKGLKVKLSDKKTKAAVEASARSITIVGSDADPWAPNGVQATFGDPLGVQAVILQGAKHFSKADGFSQWQGVIDWINDAKADLTVR
jgi:predicted alpha/beta hydrolase family esterase